MKIQIIKIALAMPCILVGLSAFAAAPILTHEDDTCKVSLKIIDATMFSPFDEEDDQDGRDVVAQALRAKNWTLATKKELKDSDDFAQVEIKFEFSEPKGNGPFKTIAVAGIGYDGSGALITKHVTGTGFLSSESFSNAINKAVSLLPTCKKK